MIHVILKDKIKPEIMNVIVALKKSTEEACKLEINRSKEFFHAQIGQYLLLKDHENANPVCALITEIKLETISLIIPGKYNKQIFHWGVGDKLLAIGGLYGKPYSLPQNKTVVCVAEGESALFVYPLVKALYRQNNSVITLFANVNNQFLFADEIRKMSSEFHSLEIDRKKLINNSLTPFLYDLLNSINVSNLFAIGHSQTVKEVLQYTARKPDLDASIVLNTIVDFVGCMRGMFAVSLSRKSKFITVDGPNFRSVYQSLEQFCQRFPIAEEKLKNQEFRSEKMVFHK